MYCHSNVIKTANILKFQLPLVATVLLKNKKRLQALKINNTILKLVKNSKYEDSAQNEEFFLKFL
jgi:hypothetical protein